MSFDIQKIFRPVLKYLEFLDTILDRIVITPAIEKDALKITFQFQTYSIIDYNVEKQEYDRKATTHTIAVDVKYIPLEEN